ncbi:MAG: hypothetical protein GY715_10155 [Planctomycetes bacterium]|nr:hypothetical protein [Planctomycetota bacterium]
MASSPRRVILAGTPLVIAVIVVWTTESIGGPLAAGLLVGAGVLGIVIFLLGRPRERGPLVEPDDMSRISDERRRELMRGTSLFLREMKYRYSVRLDTREAVDRRCFSAEVNSIRLGFIPAVVTDNSNDRQGLGFVAFVHDGNRWRGPGLPCPADQAQAVQHAARCVSPLATEEETHWEGLNP